MFRQAPHPDSAVTDAELLRRVRDGETDAFADIVVRHQPAALACARALVGADAAPDVVADSFERLLRALRKGLGPDYAARPYLLQIVRNRAVDLLRDRREIPVDLVDEPIDPRDPFSQSDESQIVRAAYQGLPDRWQAVLWLSCVDGVDRTEIGRQLGVRPGAVSQLLLRAKAGLRRAYLRLDPDSLPERCRAEWEYQVAHDGIDPVAAQREHVDHCHRCGRMVAGLGAVAGRTGVAIGTAVIGTLALAAYRQVPAALAAGTVAAAAGGAAAGGGGAGAAGAAGVPRPGLLRPATAIAAATAVVALAGIAAAAINVAGPGAERSPGSAAAAAPAPAAPPRVPTSGPASVPVTKPSREPTAPATTPAATSGPASSPTATRRHTSSPVPTKSSPTPTPTRPEPTPTTPDPTPTPTVTALLGAPSAFARGSVDLPVHIAVPVTASAGAELTLELRFDSLLAATAHADAPWAPWACAEPVAEDTGMLVTCTLAASGTTDNLAIDVGFTGTNQLTATLLASGLDPQQASLDLPVPPG
jgi:RNA polymerase sigma factor (sigma-70 family)